MNFLDTKIPKTFGILQEAIQYEINFRLSIAQPNEIAHLAKHPLDDTGTIYVESSNPISERYYSNVITITLLLIQCDSENLIIWPYVFKDFATYVPELLLYVWPDY